MEYQIISLYAAHSIYSHGFFAFIILPVENSKPKKTNFIFENVSTHGLMDFKFFSKTHWRKLLILSVPIEKIS